MQFTIGMEIPMKPINTGSAIYIAPGQGFFVSSKNASGSSVTFTKTMQLLQPQMILSLVI